MVRSSACWETRLATQAPSWPPMMTPGMVKATRRVGEKPAGETEDFGLGEVVRDRLHLCFDDV